MSLHDALPISSNVEEAAWRQIMPRIPVETRRRDRGIRQPIERDIVENVVTAQPFRLAVENAGDHLVAANVVIEYPARKTKDRKSTRLNSSHRCPYTTLFRSPLTSKKPPGGKLCRVSQ